MCSLRYSSRKHQNAKIGSSTILHNIRKKIIENITKEFNYQSLNLTKPEYVKNMYKKYYYGDNLFNLSESLWKDAAVWLD